MKHGSLFSGIGGFDMAAEWMGWENKFHCEWNEFGQKVLKHYWPHAASYGDIKQTDFTIWNGQIDVLSGGFPCQPYSLAGKRKGKEDDRHLWPEMLRAIREIQPRWVVGENVFGLVNWSGGLVFHEVQADLEAAGYEVWPYVIPACAKNAPHRRDRVWFVAYSKKANSRNGLHSRTGGIGASGMGDGWDVTNSENEGAWANNGGLRQGIRGVIDGENSVNKETHTNTGYKGLQGGEISGNIGESGKDGNKQPTGLLQPDWDKFPTQSPLCGRDDGVPTGLDRITFFEWEQQVGKMTPSKHRRESLMAYGNAVVPQVVYEIFKAIEIYEKNQKTNSHTQTTKES